MIYLDIEVNADTQMRNGDPLSWRSEITVKSKDEKEGAYPYTFSVVYVGFFRVVKEFPSELAEQLARTNGPALLYSAAREALMYLTGRGRFPAILLPSITFLEPPRTARLGGKRAASTPSKTASKKAAKKK